MSTIKQKPADYMQHLTIVYAPQSIGHRAALLHATEHVHACDSDAISQRDDLLQALNMLPNWAANDIAANARRLAACWNACIEYDTEVLERSNLHESACAADGREFELTRQRDALLQALKDLVFAQQNPQDSNRLFFALERANAAIECVEGRNP